MEGSEKNKEINALISRNEFLWDKDSADFGDYGLRRRTVQTIFEHLNTSGDNELELRGRIDACIENWKLMWIESSHLDVLDEDGNVVFHNGSPVTTATSTATSTVTSMVS